ncbi:alpha-keto acid decarboxylase family protein [Methylocystis heyeri]|uniref:Alpha-keto acid decarboxylase family protein n=1 Tax=Methylocystis heyeri TaxID=391905 RepID=A0A6B8KBB1_9HYPH|nr:thiamine pyrophosphate-binding protein [Methylocystis heyeri]QGM44355.1 alpha-keto acid decarboxylase family protein [Methylocystis heyeri]
MTESISAYLVRRLQEEGVNHVFGVPGDYCLTLFSEFERSPIQIINTCDEQGAGFAADAYARINGIGACVVTYCVGGLKAANAAAQAYAERSPLIIISGAPGRRERLRNPLLHHKVKDFDTQIRIFRELTVGTASLDDPLSAADEIDRMFALAKRHSRPVYIELPRDMALAGIAPATSGPLPPDSSDGEALDAAVEEAVARVSEARRPVILAGEELHRFHLQQPLAALVERSGIPVAATILGKSVFPECHPSYLGVYGGALSLESVQRYVESSDCLLLLGAMMTDVNLGVYTASINRRTSIYSAKDRVSVGLHTYDDVRMEDFIAALSKHDWEKRRFEPFDHPRHPGPFVPADRKMTVAALFHHINAFLDKNMIVIADPGDALFGASDLFISDGAHFLAPAYYASLGFAVPAAIGVKAAAPKLRPLVLVGDGAFQMTGIEISTAARFGMNPIVVVLDNGGYGTERPMLDGAFNDISSWRYAELAKAIPGGRGFEVETEREMEAALIEARSNVSGWSLIHVALDRDDRSSALKRFTAKLGERARGG